MARLVCGLGNGCFGRLSRHGLGARLIELLAGRRGLTWRLYPTLGAYVAELPAARPSESGSGGSAVDVEPVVLLWLIGPYNLAGWSVAAAVRRFGVAAGDPAAVTVVHDDRACFWIPSPCTFRPALCAGHSFSSQWCRRIVVERRVGALAFKDGGGLGGNNGLRSVAASLGTPEFRWAAAFGAALRT